MAPPYVGVEGKGKGSSSRVEISNYFKKKLLIIKKPSLRQLPWNIKKGIIYSTFIQKVHLNPGSKHATCFNLVVLLENHKSHALKKKNSNKNKNPGYGLL